MESDLQDKEKMHISKDPELLNILKDSFDTVSPLIYMNIEQRELLEKNMTFTWYDRKAKIYGPDDKGSYSPAFILLKGEVQIFNDKNCFEDLIENVGLFGYEGPIFHSRSKKAIVEEGTCLGIIDQETFLKVIIPFSKYCMYLSRVIIHKDKVLDSLGELKTYILSMPNNGPFNIPKLLGLYKKTNPCLHPKAQSNEIDFSAWSYALNRLPENIFETFVLVLINQAPKLLSIDPEITKELIKDVKTKARMRDTFRYIEGKNMIFVRELETDVFDFISNMCIHIIECLKLRSHIGAPRLIERIYKTGEDTKETIKVLKEETCLHISNDDEKTIFRTFGKEFSKKIININLHYQDYNLCINKIPQNKLDSVELWMQNVWSRTRKLLEIKTSIDEIDDLVVDIIQGSKRTLLGCISPHLHGNKDVIMNWAKENKIVPKTKEFPCESDRLMANSFYYYKNDKSKAAERLEVEREHGIEIIEEHFGTGVQVLLINVNKLNGNKIDPNLKFKPASKNHLILHIGYTFGAQSSAIIKPLLMLFASKARSFNIIGKAGGLTGERTDILVASRMFYDKTHELCTINYGDLDAETLKKETGSPVHIGPMLTVAGTILQNKDLLNFYKHVMGCVGLEMEGFFFIKEIDNAMRHSLLRKDFITRCFYYASDLPLDPTQNLAMEDGNVSWDEGVVSMNAIMRVIFKKLFA